MFKISTFALLSVSALILSGCYGMEKEIENNGRYWQRVDTTDAIYQRGPKAQQMLFQDMSRCTAELNEAERLGAVRNAIPPETFDSEFGRVDPNSPAGRMAKWDTPDRDGYMRTEYLDYHDFESCMAFKGWERVKYVNHDMKERAREDYLDAIGYERHRTKNGERMAKDYSKLNK